MEDVKAAGLSDLKKGIVRLEFFYRPFDNKKTYKHEYWYTILTTGDCLCIDVQCPEIGIAHLRIGFVYILICSRIYIQVTWDNLWTPKHMDYR